MRRAHALLLSLLVLLLAVPVAASANDEADKAAATAAVASELQVEGLTSDHAVLQARVVPGVANAVAVFQYGATTDYGLTATAAPAILPVKGTTATAPISGLTPATTYHFRVVVSVAGIQLLSSADATFTTAAVPPASDEDGDKSSGDDSSDDAPEPVEAPKPPKLGKSVAVGPVAGKVRVRKPHGKGFVTLAAGADVPSGSVVDATAGTVALTSAVDAAGTTQTAHFHGAAFKIVQADGKGMVDIYLRGSIGPCPSGATVAMAASSRKKSRGLWGRDHGGRFRTHGASSVATVRGTRWLTKDTCAGTLTRVTQGVVSVRDLHRHRTVTVRAGRSYLAHRR
jgi:FtsP/CotA-like multicopper oxidase with cupredoxin domain